MKKRILALTCVLSLGMMSSMPVMAAATEEAATEAAADAEEGAGAEAEATDTKPLMDGYKYCISLYYTFQLPEDYIEMSKENMQNLIDEYGEDYFTENGLDISVLENLDAGFGTMYYSGDFLSNVNIQSMINSPLTQDTLEDIKEDLDAEMLSQYTCIGVAEEDCEPQEIQQIGDNKYYVYYVTMAGQVVHQYITARDTTMLTFTFTNEDAEIEKTMVESITLH